MADGSVPIVLSPEPFARTTTYVEAPAGCTVRTMLASAITHGHLKLDDLPRTNVYVDGQRIDREETLSLVLAEGQIVNVVVEPLGGGGGGKKDIGQILLTIAVIAVSMWVGGPAGPLNAWPMLARQVAAAAILTAGQMAVAAIFKPETNVSKANDRYALSSASNQYRQWGSMPLALGEVVVAPDLAVKTFTQAQGEDQWIYGILGLHYGPCTAEDLKIGDTLVDSMGAGDVRVAYHLTPGPRTFSIVANDTDQLDLQEELAATPGGSTPVTRAASAEGERFEFDFFMPQGLYFAKDDGRKIGASLTVTIRYRPIDQNGVPTGSGAWANGLTIPLSSASSDPWRIMRALTLPLGRYEFQVQRSKLEDDNAKRKTDIGWTAIRAIAFRKPVLDETLSLIEFAVRASALNQGNLAPFTCRITPVCETWSGSAWGSPAPTSNPAAITRWLMTGPAPAIPLTKPQADVGLRTWAALCDQYNWKTHIYLTEDRKQDAVMQLLGMNGRASLFWDGTQLVSAPWVEKPAPRQLFAGSNLKDHRWEIVYPDPVHALRVEFQNIDQGGEADEIYVYADGYGETADPANNILPATLVEALRLEGQQTIERAYRDGRWNLGARMHQRRVDSWSTDIEHIVCRYGDRVRLAWDRVGTANATVRNRLWSGALVSGLRLSQPVRMEPGRTYALDLRLPDQVITGVPIVNPATTADVVTRSILFADLRNANVSPRGGDLVAFGEPERISEDVEIIGITPGTDLTANMVGIRYVAPLLMAGETGPIPPLQSRLTRDRAMDPPMPTLLGWQANEEGVRIGFSMPPWRGSPITGFTVRWRQTPAPGQSSAWLQLPDLPANAMTAVTPPLRELPAESTNVTSAQVQIVAVTADGRASPALQVTVQEAAVEQPPEGDWSITPMTSGPDGARQSGFLVIGTVASLNARRVTVEFGATAEGPWVSAFDGPPVDGVVRASIVGVQPGSQNYIAITYWTAQAVAPSERLIRGPLTAPPLVADDTLNIGGRPTPVVIQQLEDILIDVDAIAVDVGEALEQASEARTLAASGGYASMNPNPVFAKNWDSGQIPPDWQDWATGWDNTRVAGVESPNGYRISVPATGTVTQAARGIAQAGGVGSLGTAQGEAWYVQELTIKLISGSLVGAGSHIQFWNGTDLLGSTNINCAADKPLGQVAPGAGIPGQVYRYAKLFKTAANTKTIVPYAMAFWEGYWNVAPVAKDVVITKCLIRPATAGEVEEAEARGSYPSIEARLTDQNNALISATAALATRQSLTEAKAVTYPNLLPNSNMAEWPAKWEAPAWASYPHKAFGPLAYCSASGDNYMLTQDIPVNGGDTITVSIAGDPGSNPGGGGFYVQFLHANRSVISDGNGFKNYNGMSWVNRLSTTFTTHPETAFIKIVFWKGPTQDIVHIGGSVMVNFGPVALNWNDAASAREIAGRVKTSEGVLATVSGRVMSWFEKLLQAGDGTAFIQAKALDDNGDVTSEVNLGARKLGLFTQIGNGWVEVLKVVGTAAHFAGKVFIGGLQEITLDPDLPGIVWKIGGANLVIGRLPYDGMILWFGPAMAPTSMRKTNATMWLDNAGNARFLGSIFAGRLSNSVQGTSLIAPSSSTVGPFVTEGGPINIAWSYNYYREGFRIGNQGTSGQSWAIVKLFQTIGGGAETMVSQQTINGSSSAEVVNVADPFEPPSYQTTLRETITGSFTFMDTAGGTTPRTYRMEVTARQNATFGGNPAGDTQSQRSSIVTSEG
jgi:hypothetical protein